MPAVPWLKRNNVRYSQTEREAFAIVWACEHLHLYIYGKPTTVDTDHKLLVSIFGNPSSNPRPRIERWAFRLQPYQLTVHYQPRPQALWLLFLREILLRVRRGMSREAGTRTGSVERLAENAKNIGRNWKKWSFALILIFFRLFSLAMGWIQLKYGRLNGKCQENESDR